MEYGLIRHLGVESWGSACLDRVERVHGSVGEYSITESKVLKASKQAEKTRIDPTPEL